MQACLAMLGIHSAEEELLNTQEETVAWLWLEDASVSDWFHIEAVIECKIQSSATKNQPFDGAEEQVSHLQSCCVSLITFNYRNLLNASVMRKNLVSLLLACIAR